MGFAELIEKLQALPSEKQAEVMDFVEFLSARFGTGKALAEDDWTAAQFAELAMRQALRGLEDDPVAYTRDDLKERWQ